MAGRQPSDLTGGLAVVTGGARGIGRATAAALSAQGVRVAIGDLDPELTERVAAELGAGTVGLPLDVTSTESFSAFLDEAERRLGGPIDIYVNNAGIMALGPFPDERDEITARMIEVNLMGVMIGSKLAMRRLRDRDGAGKRSGAREGDGARAHIVNIASTAGRIGLPGGVTYSATKHAVVGLSEAIRAELAGTGVRVHVVLPAIVDTELAAGERRLRGVGLLDPAQVADAIIDGLRHGTVEIYVPRLIGPLLRARPLAPRGLGDRLARIFGINRVMARADPLARAAYEARIAPPTAADRAATIASAAASVADAIRDH